MPRHITPEMKQQIEEHITSKMRGSDVAKKLGVADCTVSKIWKEYTARTGVIHKRKYEVLQKLTHEQIQEIVQHSHVSAGELSRKYGVSLQRITKILKDHGIVSGGIGKGHRLTDNERTKIEDSYGVLTPTETSVKFGVSHQTVATIWRKQKLENPDLDIADKSKHAKV
jgi:DNA invertase Pin-like site-specific DNA recombinase